MPGYPDDSGSGSDYEEEDIVPRGVKKRGRPAKTAVIKRARHDTIDSEASLGPNATIYEIVRQGKMSMSSVVDDWIDAYKADRNGALLDLIQFFIHASGCKGTITPQMMQEVSEGFQDVIKQMTEQFDEDSGDYPLIAAGAYFRKFRSSFCDFVQALVRQCQYEIIYDQYMMDNILTLLTELSNSQVRAFRHTSTLAAMKLMTGLVNVALQLSVSLDNTQRQYDAEHSKSLSKRASEKLDILMQKKKELEEQQSEIEGMLNGIFKGIFVHRYRDFIAEIRALCMDEIGAWMKMFPKVFLTDSYLKYVGWTLHDKQKEVRAKCLNSLIGLYGDNEMTRDLKLFTSRFKDRIVSMTLDKEYDVAVQAIKLLHLILSNCGYDTPVLTSSDSERVYQLVFSCHRPVAVAAADFLNKQLFINKEVNPGYTKRGKRRGVNAPLITDLVLFFIESELHEHATYLVDSLWDVASVMLKDWECMSDMLLEEPANERDALDEKQESALVDIMVCSVKQAAEGVPPTGRQGYSKKTASRDRKIAIEDRLRLTEHFMVALPNLLKKFHVDREKVVGLLQIPRYFELECYTTSRREKHLDDLLAQLSVIVDKHTDPDVLEQVSRTYSHLCDDEFAIFNKVSISRRAVIDKWAENFRFALAIFKDAEDNVDEEEIYNVVQNLKRLTHLYMFNDLTQWDLYPKANSIIEMHQERPDTIPQAMLLQTVKFIYYHLLYSLAGLKNGGASSGAGAEDPRAAIAQLRKRVGEYLRACELLLASSPHKKIQEESYMSICDLLVIFAPQLAHSSPNLKSLVQRPSEPVQHSLVDFVREFVFTLPDEDDSEDDTAKIDALHQRRSLLAAICKLFVYSLIDLRLAAVVFQQYIRFYSDYGDIIKETISKTRHVNKLACAQTLALSLKTLFRDTVREQGGVLDQSSQEYGHMKELARRFALTFGLDQVKTRDAVAELHREGIVFALKRDESMFNETEPPANLTFLGILVEFSAKLMKQDKRTVLQYLDKHISPHQLSNQESLWIPLVTYRNSLLQGAGMDDDARPTAGKGRRGRRKKNMDGDFDAPPTPISPATPMHQPPTPMTPQMQPPMTPQAPMTPQPPMTPQNVMGQPQLSSTVMRGDQMRIQEDHMMEYQPFTLKDWLSGADSKATRGRVSRRERQALYDSGGTTLLKSPSKPPKPKTPSKKSKKDGPDKKAGLKQIEKNIGRKKSSVDPVSGKMMGPPEQGSASSRRRSSRGRDRQVLSYAEDSDEESDEESDEDSDDVFQEEQPQRSSGSKKKRNKKLFEEELSIDDFDETKESTEDPLSHVEEKTSSLSLEGREESTDQETSTANSTPQFKSSEIKESNKSLTEDLFLPLASDEEQNDGEDELFEFSPPAAPKLTQQSSLAGSENPFLKIVNSVKQKSDMRSSQSFEEDHISDASSSDDSTEDTPQPRPVVRSKPPIIDKFSGSSDDESSEESDDSKEEEIKPERRREEEKHSIDDSDEGGFGAFDDLVHSILQSSQESSQSDRQQTIINTPMQMNPGQNHPIPQEYHQMGYTMPQPSPIPQMGTPQHAPPQYMHPGTPSGMYQQNSGADFQTVMSPMTQPGMQSQPQYYGN